MRKKLVIKKGEKFGKLTVIKEVAQYIFPCGQEHRKVLCQCECGNKKEIVYSSLKNEGTKSCGCLMVESSTTHNMSKMRFYKIFDSIKRRCDNNKASDYDRYGGRGIKNEWKKFEDFKDDMYKNYLIHCRKYGIKNTSIDRINNNGNYCKKNCRWATSNIQSNNRRNNILITYKNKTQNIGQWSDELNINYHTLWGRLKSYNWSVEKAFNKK